jgi:hypothetical protein
VVITNASPQISDTVIDKGLFNGIDIIVVDGDNAGPVFDHVEVADSHCGFHVNSGSGMTIRNSYIHHNAYAMMVEGLVDGVFTHNNFMDNAVNLGACFGETVDAEQNYFQGAPQDGSCTNITFGASVSTPYTSDVGPRP